VPSSDSSDTSAIGFGERDDFRETDFFARVGRPLGNVPADADHCAQLRQRQNLIGKILRADSAAPEPVSCARYAGPPTSFIGSSPSK
jgi:hypothetical protein